MLARRQINVQRDNLISMCRISVKALLDYACLYTHVDDECEEFINFCAVFEHMVSHRLRPNQKKVWLPRPNSPRHFWDVLIDTQSRSHRHDTTLYFQSCIPNIDSIESFKSPQAKLRAFIRVALMEKRLSDYVMWVLDHQIVLRNHFLEGAVMLSEQASVLCGDLIGLNAIDFNFCLKGNENEFLGPLEISYSKFLRYRQTAASRSSDEIEMLRLNRAEEDDQDQEGEHNQTRAGPVLTETSVKDTLHLQQLERDFRGIKEQKDYLEELARLRERQISEMNARLDTLRAEQMAEHKEWEQERRTMDSCILELQADITKLYQQNERQRFQLASYRQFKDRMGQKEVQLTTMASMEDDEGSASKDGSRLLSVSQSSAQSTSFSQHRQEGGQFSSDGRSLMSSGSDNFRLNEDSQSLVPLTGSLVGDDGATQGTDSKDIVMKRMSQVGIEDGQPEIAENAFTLSTAPVGISKTESTSEPQQIPSSQPDKELIMMESFIVTEGRSEIEMAVQQALAIHQGSGGGDGNDIVGVTVDMATPVGEGGAGEVVASADGGDEDGKDNDDGDDSGSAVVRDGGEEEYKAVSGNGEGSVIKEDIDGCEETTQGWKMEGSNSSGQSGFSEPEHVAVTSEPEELNVTSEPEELVVTSEPEELNVTSEPEELAVSSDPEELNVTSEPEELNATSEPEELNVTSEPEELVITSEPEMVDQGNTSSDGSDTAWDMMSDSEHDGEAKKADQ